MYRYKRMMYGLKLASEDFQRIMEHCFSNLPGVKNISDDIIIYSKTIEEHIERLERLFEYVSELGLREMCFLRTKFCSLESLLEKMAFLKILKVRS